MTQPKDMLTEQLANLPQIRASDDFTNQVLNRLDEPRRSALPAPFVWSTAAALAVLLVAIVVREAGPPNAQHLDAEVAEIRRQHLQLTQELDRLRSRTEDTAPVVFLAGSERVDYVLDLSPFILTEPYQTRPASTGPDPQTF